MFLRAVPYPLQNRVRQLLEKEKWEREKRKLGANIKPVRSRCCRRACAPEGAFDRFYEGVYFFFNVRLIKRPRGAPGPRKQLSVPFELSVRVVPPDLKTIKRPFDKNHVFFKSLICFSRDP